MHIFAEALWIQKRGSSESEFEDAFWPDKPIDGDYGQFSIAIADGATESSFSSIWARQLVRSFVRHDWSDEQTFQSALATCQRNWKRITTRRPLAWYAEEKLEQGAFAAFLGLTFRSGEDQTGSFEIIVSGDCCMVQIRDDEVYRACPIVHSAEFNNSPVLLATNPPRNEQALSQIIRTYGDWRSEDAFYLMTDALAAWFLRQSEEGARPWSVLADIGTADGQAFTDFVAREQEQKQMRNDDITLYRINVI